MKFLYLKGKKEPIKIDDEKAKQITGAAMSQKEGLFVLPTGETIGIREIKYIIDEPKQEKSIIDSSEKHTENLKEHYRERDRLLSLSPVERANVSAWGHFGLFYRAIKGERPLESWRDRIRQKAAEFYEQNPDWSKPSIFLWWKLMKLSKDHPIRGDWNIAAYRILERCEGEEIEAIKKNKIFLGVKDYSLKLVFEPIV